MHPGKLTRTPVLKAYLKREVSFTTKDRFKQLRTWLAAETKSAEKETLMKTGKQVEVHGNWANLTLNVAAIQDSVQSMHFAVERKAFSLIIPAKPIQSTERMRNIIPSFRPRRVLANNRGVTKNVPLRFKDKP